MHFLGKEVTATVVLPGGKTVPLVGVKDWDFHWHERYQFVTPLNPKNPNNPPKLVEYGNNLTDEMLSCHLEVVAGSLADLRALEAMRGSRFGPGSNEETPAKHPPKIP
jgi:hypothetical protein